MQSQSRITLRKAMWRNLAKRKYSAIVKWLGTLPHRFVINLKKPDRLRRAWPEIWQSAVWNGGSCIQKKIPTTHAFLHQITYSKLWRAAQGIRARIAAVYFFKCTRFLQMHKISSADPLWDKKKCRKRKAYVSSDYSAVERLISRRTSHGTVSSQFALVIYFNTFLTY